MFMMGVPIMVALQGVSHKALSTLGEYLFTEPHAQPSGEKLHHSSTQFYLKIVNTSAERTQEIKTPN
jgi:hypothetical protein